MRRRQGRVMAAALATALVAGLLSVGPAVAAPDFCATGITTVQDLPAQVDSGDCDLVGRTISVDDLRVTVPPPGQGRSVAGLSAAGEVTLDVATSPDGLVEFAVEDHLAVVQQSATYGAASYVAGGDAFAQATPMPIPNSFMPFVGQTFNPATSTLQPGEPAAGCDKTAVGSVWYRIGRIGSLRRIELRSDVPVALYRGTTLGGLQRAACIPAWEHPKLITLAPTGVYYVQAAVTAADAAAGKAASHVWLTNGELRPDGTPPCDSRAFDLVNQITARKPLRWRFNAGSTPRSVTAAEALRGIKQGMSIVTQSRNDCGLADTVDARQAYLGTTSKAPTMCTRGRSDEVNTIGFAELPAGMLGLSCSAWTIAATGKRHTFESDVVLTNLVRWTMNPDSPTCDDESDVVGVAAHEIAHAFGIDHALGVAGLNQTMSTSVSSCNGAARTLGKGDVLALRKLY